MGSEQLADVPGVLPLGVDLGGARSDLLLRQPLDELAEVAQLLGHLVDAGSGGHRFAHAIGAYSGGSARTTIT